MDEGEVDAGFQQVFEKFTKNEGVDVKKGKNEQEEEEVKDNVRSVKEVKAEKEVEDKGISKKKIKIQSRMSIFDLKMQAERPDLVENWDVTAPDPLFLIQLKQVRNSVLVPKHWSHKRRYLQYKRGIHKRPF